MGESHCSDWAEPTVLRVFALQFSDRFSLQSSGSAPSSRIVAPFDSEVDSEAGWLDVSRAASDALLSERVELAVGVEDAVDDVVDVSVLVGVAAGLEGSAGRGLSISPCSPITDEAVVRLMSCTRSSPAVTEGRDHRRVGMEITQAQRSLFEKIDSLELTDGERAAFGELLGVDAASEVEAFGYDGPPKIIVQGFDLGFTLQRQFSLGVVDHKSDDVVDHKSDD